MNISSSIMCLIFSLYFISFFAVLCSVAGEVVRS